MELRILCMGVEAAFNRLDDEAKLVHDRVCSQPGAPLPLKYQPLVRIVLIWLTGAMDLFNRSIKKTASSLATVRDLSFPR